MHVGAFLRWHFDMERKHHPEGGRYLGQHDSPDSAAAHEQQPFAHLREVAQEGCLHFGHA